MGSARQTSVEFEAQLARAKCAKGLRRLAEACAYRVKDAEAMGWAALAQSWRHCLDRVEAKRVALGQ